MATRQGACPGATPGNRTTLFTISDLVLMICRALRANRTGCASARSRVSKTQPTPGSTEAACQIVNHKSFMGPWLKSEAPALQAEPSGSVTRRTPPISTGLRETRPMHREKPHKLLQVGVTPTPATTACAEPPREVIRLPDSKSGVTK